MKKSIYTIAHEYAEIADLVNPWEFNDAWGSKVECIRVTAEKLVSDPVTIWNEVDDMIEMIDPESTILSLAEQLQTDVGECVSFWLRNRGTKTGIITIRR